MSTLRFVRVWLPSIVVIGGVLIMVIGRNDNAYDGGAGVIGAGLSIALLNFLHRVGVSGDSDRVEEDAAREFFDRHGRWPDEDAPPAPAPPAAPDDAPPRDPHRRAPLAGNRPPRRR